MDVTVNVIWGAPNQTQEIVTNLTWNDRALLLGEQRDALPSTKGIHSYVSRLLFDLSDPA